MPARSIFDDFMDAQLRILAKREPHDIDPYTQLPNDFTRMLAVKVDPYNDTRNSWESGNRRRGAIIPASQGKIEPMTDEPKNQVTLVPANDGFEDGATDQRLIQGDIIKCVDGHWASRDGTPIPTRTRRIALATTTAVQLWRDQMPVETIIKQPGQALPDIDELNDKIPKETWEEGLDGEPRPPWTKQFAVYLLDPKDASISTFINSTTGAAIAVDKLKDKVRWMRALRGERVVPLVELSSKVMKTKFGQKMRPEFEVIEWRDLGAGLEAKPAVPALGKPVTEPTLAEEMDDSVDDI